MATEVLLSFANAGLGSIFATWLRRRIMLAKDLYDTRSVYMDNIAMREMDGTTLTQDTRFRQSDYGITLIGAMNDNWNSHYLRAMAECKSMIIVATSEWSASKWCWHEFDQSEQQTTLRGKSGGTFNRVALVFPDTPVETRAKLQASGWKLLQTRKIVVGGTGVKGDFAEAAAHKGAWVISETDLKQLLSMI